MEIRIKPAVQFLVVEFCPIITQMVSCTSNCFSVLFGGEAAFQIDRPTGSCHCAKMDALAKMVSAHLQSAHCAEAPNRPLQLFSTGNLVLTIGNSFLGRLSNR